MPEIKIPGYEVKSELGHGGMAHVYLAIQESFGREVALKVLSPHLADDEEFSKRFLREARIVSQLNHPNIVTVFDAGKHEKSNYMSMEYIPGKDLRQLKDSISRKDAVRIVKDVARALNFAGNKGVVHRDIKPENIMIHETDKRVILMDFGIAYGEDTTHGMTQTGKAIGTPHFMSPEQTKGLKVDHRSDIYSLGVVLFQLLASHLPFDAESAVAVGIKHLTAPIPLLPIGLEIFQPIINRCLSKQPEHRYQNAGELITALEQITDAQLESIKTQATVFKKAGADHNAATQIGDAADVAEMVTSQKRKIPDLVFPSSKRKKITEKNSDDSNKKSTRRRSLLLLLLLVTIVWAGNKKQKELTHFWGYKALPKIVKSFPDLFPKSYTEYWTNKKREENKTVEVTATPDVATNISTSPVESGQQAEQPVNLPKKDKLTLLKEGLDSNPENAIQLAAIYKEKLLESKADPVARKELKELREWFINQVRLAVASEDVENSRQYIEIMKQSFPRATKNKRVIHLERKIAFLERINVHLIKAENYFKAGALSKPANNNALNEVKKALKLSPNSENAKMFMEKIVNTYLDKTAELQQQGNEHNALLMVEEGIAALNNNPILVKKRHDIKDQIKNKKIIKSLFTKAEKYQTAGQLITPKAYNAYYYYQKILEKDNGNLQAKAGLKAIHQQLAKNIVTSINNNELDVAKILLQAAIERYGKSSLLASAQLKLNDALGELAPKIEKIKLSGSPVNNLAINHLKKSPSSNVETLKLNKTLYVGFNFMNFDAKTTWLDATLVDNTKGITIAQKPVVISTRFGQHFFEVNMPQRNFGNSKYKIELKLKNRTLISKSFFVKN